MALQTPSPEQSPCTYLPFLYSRNGPPRLVTSEVAQGARKLLTLWTPAGASLRTLESPVVDLSKDVVWPVHTPVCTGHVQEVRTLPGTAVAGKQS